MINSSSSVKPRFVTFHLTASQLIRCAASLFQSKAMPNFTADISVFKQRCSMDLRLLRKCRKSKVSIAAPTRLAPLLFDSSGNVYGAATYGGSTNSGVVYELTPASGVSTEMVLYGFTGGEDGSHLRGITFDGQGNIYGVAAYGGGNQDCGYGCGTLYKLTHSQSGWAETTLHTFRQGVDGGWPGPLIRDKAGNPYGITESYGPNNNGGTVWELSPSGSGWTFQVLHALPTATVNDFGPYPLTMDSSGNLYGIVNWGGANNEGLLFKLTPANGRWKYTDLHDFGQDGCYPQGSGDSRCPRQAVPHRRELWNV